MNAILLFFITNLILHLPIAQASGLDHSGNQLAADIYLQEEMVYYRGKITSKNVVRFMNIVQGKTVRSLVITSTGGEINAGMDLGDWIFAKQINITIEDYCLSTCANYIFTAGYEKKILPRAIVAWHGNSFQKTGLSEADIREKTKLFLQSLPPEKRQGLDVGSMVKKALQEMRNNQTRERAFFDKIGVNGQVCLLGQNEDSKVADFHILSVSDMKRFGINRVHVTSKYEDTNLARFNKKRERVRLIRLPPHSYQDQN